MTTKITITIFLWLLFAAFTTLFGVMPKDLNEFGIGFIICLIFWGGMFFIPVLGNLIAQEAERKTEQD